MVMDFLSRISVPVYAADQVPPGAACPYLTYAMTGAGFGGKGTLTVTAWTRDDFAGCVRLMDRVGGLLCGGQEILVGAHGAAFVRFEQAEMLTPGADRRMTGGRVRLAMQVYEQGRGGDGRC